MASRMSESGRGRQSTESGPKAAAGRCDRVRLPAGFRRAHPGYSCQQRARRRDMARGKPKKGRKGKRSAVEQVVVPVASTVVLATAAVHSLVDRQSTDRNGHDGDLPHPAPPPEPKSLQDRVGDKLPWLKPILAVQKRYGDVGANQLAAAFTLQAFLSLFPLVLVAIAVIGFVASGARVDLAGRLIQQLSLKGEAANLFR